MTYEYLCHACAHEWEADQRITEDPLKKCPKCKKLKAKRQISGGTGFLLKGGGWYADGYGASPLSKSGDSDSSSSGSSDDSSSSKSDSKTDKSDKSSKPSKPSKSSKSESKKTGSTAA